MTPGGMDPYYGQWYSDDDPADYRRGPSGWCNLEGDEQAKERQPLRRIDATTYPARIPHRHYLRNRKDGE
tara:strand:+ start:255 stop:464 length:210 start_codon:yes stop_codon:yes gene_type:complete